jgi:diguanylate cyclase (GGDEF)-like protein
LNDARRRAEYAATPDSPVDGAGDVDVLAALTTVGEAAYAWTIADDRLLWSTNAGAVFGLSAIDGIATGRGYAEIVDPAATANRHDTILNGVAVDHGEGVAYEIQYSILPDGAGSERRLFVEDVGRWYADGIGRPARAHGVVRIVNERYEREQRLAFLSRYDELTGYFNRQHLLTTLGEALVAAKRSRASIAFMIVAIDNFTAMNEAYGFETADQVFAAVAKRIRSQLRDGDAIGRYSGNKLGILLMNCEEADMHAAAERFHAVVRGGVVATPTSSVAVTVSIGGVGLPRHAKTVNVALARAQESLHLARLRGYGRFVAYAPSATRQAIRRQNAALSSELVAAIGGGRLKLVFQPVVDIETRRPVFHEGLLRLERNDGSLVPAKDFIDLCERLGLIRLIDEFARDRIVEALQAAPEATLSINVSAETVADGEWISRLADAVSGRPDLSRRLIVEVTESAVIRNLEEASHFIATIHDLGARAAIDDFGAGFSSFRSLRSLAFDIVKIDGGFVENLATSRDDQVFVRALSELARTFEIDVVAEWVQDEQTVTLLRQFGVNMLQGTLTGAAVPDPILTAGVPTSASRAS